MDHDYLDDDLDLSDRDWQELETKAVQFTQAQSLKPPTQNQLSSRLANANPSLDGFDSEDEDLDGSVLNAPLVISGPRHPAVHSFAHPLPPNQNRPAWNQASQGGPAVHRPYGPGPGPGPGPGQGHSFASQRFQVPMLNQNRQAPSQFPRAFAPPPLRYAPSQSQAVNAHPNAVAALEQRIRSLENDLNVSKGEVSILRSKEAKSRQAHDAELTRIKAQHAEQLGKQQKLLEDVALKERTANTELQFMQRDLQEVASRARRKDGGGGTANGLGGGAVAGAGPGLGLATTPKKSARNWSMTDGFDGIDLASSPSPTKALGRPKPGPATVSAPDRTPTKGKRKRPVADSPMLPLETHSRDVEMADGVSIGGAQAGAAVNTSSTSHPLSFDFLPLVLDHASTYGQPPTFDAFSQYSFPSDPDTSFSSIIFSSLRVRTDPQPFMLLSDFSILIVNLWARCVEEQLFAPIKELVSLLTFTMQLPNMSVTQRLVYELVAVAENTLYMMVNARMQTSDGDISKDPDYQALHTSVDSTEILLLVYLTALACAGSPEEEADGVGAGVPIRTGFWQRLSLDLVRGILSPKQPLRDVVVMLSLLCASVRPEGIGPVDPNGDAERVAKLTLDYVSRLLNHPPLAARSPRQKHAISNAALQTLLAFTSSAFGINQVATHAVVIDRLVLVLSVAVNELYDQDISIELPQVGKAGREMRREGDPLSASEMGSDAKGLCQVISQATLLLYTLVTDPRNSSVVDITSKSLGSHGGSNRYQIALCRLSCAEEDLVLEAGIDTETADRATELLNLLLTPDEAKIIGEAFVSGE